MHIIDNRLQGLRTHMKEKGLDAYIIVGSDPHASEYVTPRWRTREWISGFTGSAGTVVVTMDQALLWVDSRYYIQGEQEIAKTEFSLQKMEEKGVLDPISWISEHIPRAGIVGIDGSTVSVSTSRMYQQTCRRKDQHLVFTEDLLQYIWLDRPKEPTSEVYEIPDLITGASRSEKIERIRESLTQHHCDGTLISSLDDIAWILNVRGGDIAYNPLFLSYLYIDMNRFVLFIDDSRIDEKTALKLHAEGTILPYEQLYDFIQNGENLGKRIYLSPEKTTMSVYEALPDEIEYVEGRDFSTSFKAKKNHIELEGMRRAHVHDGVAMVKLLATLAKKEQTFTELTIVDQLERFRKEQKEYLGPSFAPIAGYGAHGAIVHYSSSEETSVPLLEDNLLVLDTGGQYETGMTDITRTLLFGNPTKEMIQDYTLVLKGNLALAAQRFPEGTCGYQLDVLAKQALWQERSTYKHGTGHGVGFRLNVHEGPQNISSKPIMVPLEAGMVLSDEPGIYKQGSYGIRIENLIAVQEGETNEFGKFFFFEVLTLVPFERKLINTALLTQREIVMIDSYHAWVYTELSEKLSTEERSWLREATLPL